MSTAADPADPDRTIEALHAAAMSRTGLSDFGPDGYRKPFAMLAAHLASPALTARLAANPAGKHGEHRYDLQDYGVTEQQIRDALGEG